VSSKTATPEFIVYLAASLQTNVGILAALLNCTPLAAASQVFLQKCSLFFSAKLCGADIGNRLAPWHDFRYKQAAFLRLSAFP
jgi:hypothetical protein